MENIYIEGHNGEHFTPTVDFNCDTGVCTLEGKSYLENPVEFYTPLFQWLKTYILDIKKPLTFNFKLSYFNTSSSKCIIDILHILKKYENENGQVKIKWYYDAEDEDAEDEIEEVEDFMIESGVKMELVAK